MPRQSPYNCPNCGKRGKWIGEGDAFECLDCPFYWLVPGYGKIQWELKNQRWLRKITCIHCGKLTEGKPESIHQYKDYRWSNLLKLGYFHDDCIIEYNQEAEKAERDQDLALKFIEAMTTIPCPNCSQFDIIPAPEGYDGVIWFCINCETEVSIDWLKEKTGLPYPYE